MINSAPIDYPTYSSARTHLKDVLDSAENGQSVTVARDGRVSVVLNAERLRDFFAHTVPSRVEVAHEDNCVIALMTEQPFVSEGTTIDAALADLIQSLREYAEDWESRLQHAPNHRDNWGLVQLIKLSSDRELLEWFERGSE